MFTTKTQTEGMRLTLTVPCNSSVLYIQFLNNPLRMSDRLANSSSSFFDVKTVQEILVYVSDVRPWPWP